MKISLLILSTLFASSFAGCPNKCSGHGNCSLGDTCKCQPRWVGPDCSGRECPYGVSFVTSADTESAPSGSSKVLFESELSDNMADDTSGIKHLATSNSASCGADDCFNGKLIQFLSGFNASADVLGGIWSLPYNIADYDYANRAFTIDDANGNTPGATLLAGTKIRVITNEPHGLSGMHEYTECSSKGSCDRSTGECACFDGYDGRGCRRQACPNACSGHGRCLENNVVNTLYAPNVDHPNEHVSQYWDYKKAQQCSCDRGWEGYDCSSRMCPTGDDPMTDCNLDNDTQIADVQVLDFAEFTGDGYVTLTFTDMFNGSYTTTPIYFSTHAATDTAALIHRQKAATDIESALEALPNFAVPNVTVSHTANSAHKYYVTFVDEANAGYQNLLKCSDATAAQTTYNNPNMQPRFQEPKVAADKDGAACHVMHQAVPGGKAIKENTVCSERGLCDGSTGTCTCFEGYSGEACAVQTVFF